jgi:hypothetical protein
MPEIPPVQPLHELCDQWAADKAAYIEKLVDTAPPLTAEQKDRLAVILRTGRTPDDREAA